MKKRKNREVGKKLMSSILALTMAMGFTPGIALAASESVDEKLVKSLAKLYDGDDERARQELAALYQAGIIDENGNMVELDICEDGEAVSLEDICARINAGEEIGDLTVNGHAATQEQLCKIQAVGNALEVAKMLAEDVEITDEHVENLESLIQGISDGSIDINSAIENGSVSVGSTRKMASAKGAPMRAAGASADSDFPETMTNTGEIEADADGKYADTYISNSTYEDSHNFQLSDPENTTYYTDSRYQGTDYTDSESASTPVITLSTVDSVQLATDYFKSITVTATLPEAQSAPVSFDWSVGGGFDFDAVASVSTSFSPSGTVTIPAGETSATFRVSLPACNVFSSYNYYGDPYSWDGVDPYVGSKAFVINVSNLKGAVLEDNKTTWSKTVLVSNAYDSEYAKFFVHMKYPIAESLGTVTASMAANYSYSGQDGNNYYQQFGGGPVTQYNAGDCVRFIVHFKNQKSGSDLNDAGFKMWMYTDTSATNRVVDNENHTVILEGTSNYNSTNAGVAVTFYNSSAPLAVVDSVDVERPRPSALATITDISVPSGTYYSGQIVPITVTLNNYALSTENTKLSVNNTECPLLDSVGTESKAFTFGYTVKEEDTGAINVTGLNGGFVNSEGDTVVIDGNFTERSFDKENGNVQLVSAVKENSIDYANAKYGISDDAAGEQVATVVIPLVSGKSVQWIGSESADCTTDGKGIEMELPDYGTVTVRDYLKSSYFSYDNGKTRFPVYVVRTGVSETPVALVCRMAPPLNEVSSLRKDTINLFMDTAVGIDDAAKYVDTWENALTDEMGYAYFDGSGKTDSANIVAGQSFSFYTKGCVLFDQTAYISRGEADYSQWTADGWLNLDDGNHVLLNDPEHPENRYDAEILVNDTLYNALRNGIRAEEISGNMTLTAQFSDRKNFTFVDPRHYEWVSSDESIATVEKDENGVGYVQFTGKAGAVEFTLHIKNGSSKYAYDVGTVELKVLEGKTPFLTISEYSQLRQTLTGADTDVAFASNITARNAELGKDTTFTATLYRAEEDQGAYHKTGEAVWTGNFTSTLTNTLTHITVPGSELPSAGAYVLEITAEYQGGTVNGVEQLSMPLSASASIVAEQAPASVKLNQLDSYYVTSDKIPAIGYTVSDGAQVEYTIQKSGEPVGERKSVTGGVIPFEPTTPASLKEAYTITIYARNSAEDDWSLDSMLLTVYNPDILHLIVKEVTAGEIGGTTDGTGDHADGTTIRMDNHDKITGYVSADGYRLNFDDFTALRTDISLQKIVSINYGEAVYGMLSDKMMWESSDPRTVSVDYKQGGIYSDIRNYSYTSYAPATDFLIVGKDDTAEGKTVTIKATHANTGISSSFEVTTKTLKEQLYLFQFYPAVATTVTYTNGNGIKRQLTTDASGKLAVYEPDGIDGHVMVMGKDDQGNTYVGTLFHNDMETGEHDVASLQLYPCNNLRLRAISNVELTFLTPDGKPYSGEVTIRGGAYKNGKYCPDAKIRVGDTGAEQNGREDIQATVTNGKLKLCLDPTQFKIDPNNNEERFGAQPGDKITYVFEYRFAGTYQPGFVTLNASTDLYGESSPTDSVVYMRNNTVDDAMPQIIHQNLQQYYDGTQANPYTRNVIDYTNNIGVSMRFSKAVLTTDAALPGEEVSKDANGYTTYSSDTVLDFGLFTPNNQAFTGQSDNKNKTEADQIIDLADLKESTLFVFPFSKVPVIRSFYTMTDANLKADGLTDIGENPNPFSSAKAVFIKDDQTIKTETMPFGVSNLSHQRDLSTEEGGAEEVGKEVESELQNKLDIGAAFDEIEVNEMLQKGFLYLSKLASTAGAPPICMMILPTEDPGTFRIIASIGYNKHESLKTNSNPSIDFDSEHLYDDYESFEDELEELGKDDGDDDDDEGGEGSVDINFYGMVILEAKVGTLGSKWDIDFCGGSVGANFEAKYEWNQNFLCGPVPVTISFAVKGTADLEVSFANKADARALLIDAAVGVSIEAFAGIGFDMSLFALKLGIFGKIGADVDFLYLTKDNQTGTKIDIAGEIGIKLKVKVAFVSYEKVFASTGFNWTRKWGYDEVREAWENNGYAEMSGLTTSGKKYSMKLLSNGTAMVTIDGGNEIENRDYLNSAPRMMKSRVLSFKRSADGMLMLDDNAYPYSNPVMTDDGSMYLYISDNNNPDKPESVICYAVKNGSGYTDMGRVDTSDGNILADSDVVASGTGDNAFAAWIKQMDSPDKEMHDSITYDDLGMMLNATEIYGGSYVNGEWTVQRLTDNTVADMAPTIASSGNKAIVAWRSLSATEMPEEESTQDITTMFNVKNTINYRIFDGTEWKEAQIVYNGSAGTVNAVNAAMLSDGTSLVVYTVRTTDDVTGSETFYTLIDADGNVVTTGRLTNDNYTDTNAQVTTVGNQFIVGWYSEHDAGEKENNKETVVSHDIGLARINANGSIDADFPESIGGSATAKIGSDFHFSAPVGNTDLSKLSIVWSQQKESDKAEDDGKYQLNAVCFFEQDGIIGVSAPTTIAETAKNYTIDQFDTYTEPDGEVKAILVGSDYSNIDGLSVYDTIDLTNLPINAVNDAGESADHLDILAQDPITSMKLASGRFEESKIEAEVNTDLRNLIPGLDLPVQFTIRNTGTGKVNDVQAQIGSQSAEVKGLHLLPGQSAVITVNYTVPENVSDVDYTLTADGNGTTSGTLVLNRPDVGISGMQVVREGDKERDIRLTLSNASENPLTGSGKTVKLAFYKDMRHENQIGETVTIDSSAYQEIDQDIYTYIYTVNVSDLIGTEAEVPDQGVRLYASTWVEDTDELYTMNNNANVTINGLLSKYKSLTTMDTALVKGDDDSYTINADITNNSMQNADLGSITADVLDSEGKVITSVVMTENALTLTGEQNVKLSKALDPELPDVPVSVSLRSSEKSVILDVQTNLGTSDVAALALTADNKPAGQLPTATREGYDFIGWFTEPIGGDQVTADTVLEGGMTLYAQFHSDEVVDAEHADFEFTASGYEGTYDGEEHGVSVSTQAEGANIYFSTEELDLASFIAADQTDSPQFTDAGEYTVYYCITTLKYKTVIDSLTVKIDQAEITPTVTLNGWLYGANANEPSVTGNPGNGTVTYQYKVKGADDSTYSDDVPTVVGEYTVKATVAATRNYLGNTATADFAITKAGSTPEVLITGWNYGETANAPSLSVNPGNAPVTYEYKVKDADDSTYSADVPTNAGNYTVRATVAETEYYSGAIVTTDFTIAKAPINPTLSIEGWVYGQYDETVNAPILTGNTDNGAVEYQYKRKDLSDQYYYASVPTSTGEYTLKAVIAETDNYAGATVTADFTIAKKPCYATVSIRNWTVGGKPQQPEVSGFTGNYSAIVYEYKVKGADDSTYSTYIYNNTNSVPKDIGEYTLRATFPESGTCLAGTATVDFKILKPTRPNSPNVYIPNWSYGSTPSTPRVSNNTYNSDVTFWYKVNGANDSTYSETVPTDVGDYKLKAIFSETEDYAEYVVIKDFKIYKASMNPQVFIENWAKDEEASTPTMTGIIEDCEVTYEYKVKGAEDSTYSETVPSDPGEYTIRATIEETPTHYGYTRTKDFTIYEIAVRPEISITGWAFGETANAPIVTGIPEGAEVAYRYKVKSAADSSYSATVPSAVGEYTVKVIVVGTSAYARAEATADFTISKAPINPTVYITGWTYGGSSNYPSVTGNNGNGSVTYEYKVKDADDDTYTTTRPNTAGEYTVRATIAETARYLGNTATADFAITQASINASVSISNWTFGATPNNPTVYYNKGNGAVTYEYKLQSADDSAYSETVPTNAGDYTIRAAIAETENYYGATATANFTISKAKINPTVSIEGWTYGEEPNTPTVTGNIGNGEVTISYKKTTGSGNWSTEVPTDAGTYSFFARIAETANTSSGQSSFTNFTISKATINPEVSIEGWIVGTTPNQPTVTGNIGNGTVTYTYAVKGTSDFSSTVPTDEGDYTVKAVIGETSNTYSGEATADFTIFHDEAADQAAADAVADRINALPAAADVTVDDKDDIEAARAAYEALTDAQKELINADTLAILEAAEEALSAAELVEVKSAATNEVNAVNATDYIAADRQTVTNAKSTALAAIEAATTVAEVETALESFNNAIADCTTQAAADLAAADAVADAINALPAEVTVDDKDAVEAARAAYEALTDIQKDLVDTDVLAKLAAAEEALIPELVNESYIQNDATEIILGSRIKVYGAASGGKGEYAYAFYYRKTANDNWHEMAPAYTTQSASCKPAIVANYELKVIAKDACGTTEEKIFSVKVKKPLTNDSTINAEEIEIGEKIVVSGTASGGTGDYTYAFYYKKSSGSNWYQMAEPYTTKHAAFKPAATVSYDVKVIVKDANGNTEEKIFTVKVNGPLVNKSYVVTTDAKVGEKVRVKGAASGGAGGYTYAFYYKKSSKSDWYKMAEPYTTKTAAFKPASATGYDVKVIAKDAHGNTEEVIYTVDVTK